MGKVALSWSSGKDSAWSLHLLRSRGIEVERLVTTVNETHGRVAMHGVRRELLEAQAEAAGIELLTIELPWAASNAIYESRMREAVEQLVADGFDRMAFGDLYLQDIREYREAQLAGTGIEPLFPLWQRPTAELAREMLDAGMEARITCVDSRRLPADFAGSLWNSNLIATLPEGVDPCGENGEFHTFVSAGPMFRWPVPNIVGETVDRDGFLFTDILADPCVQVSRDRPSTSAETGDIL